MNPIIEQLAAGEGYEVAGTHDEAIRLDANENPYPLPAGLQEELFERWRQVDIGRYPSTKLAERVRALLADYVGVGPEQVVLGNGSDAGIQGLLNLFGQFCQEVVIPGPTFGFYYQACQAVGLTVREVELDREFNLSPAALEAALERGPKEGERAVILCRPNNPTGDSWPLATVEAALADDRTWVVVDEAYAEFAGESLVSWVSRYPRLVVLRTLSKAFGLAGLRVGYAVAQPQVARALSRAIQPYAVTALALTAAELMLENREVVEDRIAKFVAGREWLRKALTDLPGFVPLPSKTNFLLVYVDPARVRQGATGVYESLVSQGIHIRMFPWDQRLNDHLRISVGSTAENEALLRALR